ncbi:MAG: alpha/beta hydrolase [Acidobacteria bacterium]|nr:alpha/beta hydrolase [Acidobacteriota bacterium]
MPPEPLREISGPVGRLEALLDLPADQPRAGVVFAHPHPLHGGTLHTKVVYQAAKALARVGCAVLRFNFRGVGRSAGDFDAGPGEMDDFRAALDVTSERYPSVPLWAAGFSFGSWVASTVGAADSRVALVLAIAPPVDRYDFGALQSCAKPKFFIHGERDELISIKAMRRFYAQLPEPKELVEIEDATHLFEGKTSEVGDAVADLLADYHAPGTGR